MRVAASHRFSRTVRPSNTLGTCVLMPTPRRAISCGSAPVTSSPRTQNRARCRLELAGQHLEEGALAGAVRADQTTQLALGEREVDVPDRMHAAEAHAQTAGLDQRRRSPRRSRARRARRATSSSPIVGTRPFGTRRTKATRIAPRMSGTLPSRACQSASPLGALAPRAAVSH